MMKYNEERSKKDFGHSEVGTILGEGKKWFELQFKDLLNNWASVNIISL